MMLADRDDISVPEPLPALSTKRLLAMTWLEGRPFGEFESAPLKARNGIAVALFKAWWRPFARYGVIHGDPHLGNYTVRADGGVNLLDYGCIRTFRPDFVDGVVALYRALQRRDNRLAAKAYAAWGFSDLSDASVEVLNLWARFIFTPLLDDRVRVVDDGVPAAEYGLRQANEVFAKLKALGGVRPPREFVFMDRAAIGLGAALIRLGARLNFHTLFEEEIADFDVGALAARQKKAFKATGVPLPGAA
jgi:predicted unusual protein kinase regulating ubiquinone biosynthesis (AarF/ABC1/UbiB family)